MTRGGVMNLKVNDIITNLAEKNGFRITYQRKKILEILIENKDKHISVEEVYSITKKKNMTIALPTIYRTMGLLENAGVIIKNDFGGGAAKYEFCLETHHHLICERCGKIIEISGLLPDDLSKRLLDEKGFQLRDQSLKIYGYCKECLSQMMKSYPDHES